MDDNPANGDIEQQTQTSIPPTPALAEVSADATEIPENATEEADAELNTEAANESKNDGTDAGETKDDELVSLKADEESAQEQKLVDEKVDDGNVGDDAPEVVDENKDTEPNAEVTDAPATDGAEESVVLDAGDNIIQDGAASVDVEKSEDVQDAPLPTSPGKAPTPQDGDQAPVPSAAAEEASEEVPEVAAEDVPEIAAEDVHEIAAVDVPEVAEVTEEGGISEQAEMSTELPEQMETAEIAAQSPMPSAGGPEEKIEEQKLSQPGTPGSTADGEALRLAEQSRSSDHDGGIPRPPTIPEESSVSKATAKDNFPKSEGPTQPLNLEWTFGLNRRVPCINLTDENRTLILYAASHIAVLYDYKNNRQKLLQGHGNAITCMACSEDKRWLVTGDKGPGSCVIVWDSYTGIPVQTLFDVHGDEGVIALGISEDAKYIVAISAGSPQLVSVWDWTSMSDSPLHYVELDPLYHQQTYVKFHPLNNQLFVTNSETQVVFYSWSTGELEFHAPFLSDSVFNRAVGLFSQSVFQVEPSTRALTATALGNIVVWDPDRPNGRNGASVAIYKKRALKLVRVKDKGLTALSQTEGMIVAGDTSGHVTFFDEQLNLINWYLDFKIGSINGITFKYTPDFVTESSSEAKNYPDDATIQARTFVVRDFIVSTKSAEIVHVETDGTRVSRIYKEHDAAVHALAACPTKPWICIGSYASLLKLWDYEEKKVLVRRVFANKAKIQCIAFSHDGLQIAVGMTSGTVHIIDTMSLSDEISFHYARDAITHCAFSHNSKYLATADAQYTTTVFVYDTSSGWMYLGRHKAHYEPIQDLVFNIDLDSNQPRLLTLGKDRVLVEYDIKSSSKDNLKLQSVDRIEQSAVPLCLAWYPPVTKETFLVTANNQYKMKLYNTTTKMCRKTLLGPTYGSPARLISIVPTPAGTDPSVNRMLCYATDNKVGVQLLPLDGNPHRSVSSIAHPGGVSRLVCSNDGKYIFTAGGKEAAVHMWSINSKSLEAVAALGGDGLIPFYGLLDGGREGEMFGELENYFYYAQLRSQGISTTEERDVSTVVPLDQVPFLMRALGFYPSEQEVEDMLNEVKFSEYVESGQYVTEIDLAEFIKLYINHRPAFGLSPDDLRNAFQVIGSVDGGNEYGVDRSQLLSMLQRKGEHMTEFELAECLTTLLGYCPEGGSVETGQGRDHDEASKDLEEALPESISASLFAREILGLNLYG